MTWNETMGVLANDGFASICEIQHTSLAQKVNNFHLTVYEDEDGQMFCSGRWDREHFGGELDLKHSRSVMMPIILRATKEVRYSNFDIFLLDAEYRDAFGNKVKDPNEAATVHSKIFVPELTPSLMRIFIMNAEGQEVLPGHTIFADSDLINGEDPAMSTDTTTTH